MIFKFNLLEALNEQFDTEVKFDWCIFQSYQDASRLSYGIYDFVIPSKRLIVEMDSGLGHGRHTFSSVNSISKEESIYRDNMKTLLAQSHQYQIVRIQCPYSGNLTKRFDVCKNTVLQSPLSSIYDLDNIDWNLINENSLNSFTRISCELYKQGWNIKDIATKFKRSEYTIRSYIAVGTNLGLC